MPSSPPSDRPARYYVGARLYHDRPGGAPLAMWPVYDRGPELERTNDPELRAQCVYRGDAEDLAEHLNALVR